MPSPIGHALGGIAAGSLISRDRRWMSLVVFAVAGVLPDIDFLLPLQHRGPSHSLIAALATLGVAWGLVRNLRLAIAVAAAYASHTLLDWLGEDTWSPMGVMVLWPFSHQYYVSGVDLFAAVNRH